MTRYKYLVIFVSVAVFQFDVVDSLLLCPIVVANAPALQFIGLLGGLLPQLGNHLMLLYIISISITGFSLVISFVWREYSLIEFEMKPTYVVMHMTHFLLTFVAYLYVFPMFKQCLSSLGDVFAFLDVAKAVYQKDKAIFCVTSDKLPQLAHFGIYSLVVTTIVSSYVWKAILRIRHEVNRPRHNWSPNSIRIHKMLLKSLIFQVFTPIIFFVIPLMLVITVVFIHPRFIPAPTMDAINQQVSAITLVIPSFYSTIHVTTVIYFTTPYRHFVKSLFTTSRSIKYIRNAEFSKISRKKQPAEEFSEEVERTQIPREPTVSA